MVMEATGAGREEAEAGALSRPITMLSRHIWMILERAGCGGRESQTRCAITAATGGIRNQQRRLWTKQQRCLASDILQRIGGEKIFSV